MGVLGGWAISHGRGTPVGWAIYSRGDGRGDALRGVWKYNPMCKITPAILHGVVSTDINPCRMNGVTLHDRSDFTRLKCLYTTRVTSHDRSDFARRVGVPANCSPDRRVHHASLPLSHSLSLSLSLSLSFSLSLSLPRSLSPSLSPSLSISLSLFLSRSLFLSLPLRRVRQSLPLWREGERARETETQRQRERERERVCVCEREREREEERGTGGAQVRFPTEQGGLESKRGASTG